MNRHCIRRTGLRHAQGISLIELLVGIVVSMLTVLVITQLFLASEKQRRIPSSNAEAQINGVLALDAIQRDVRQAGYGMSGGPWLGACTTTNLSAPKAVGLANLPLAPVVITPGTSTPSDSIDVLFSGKISAAMPLKLTENHSANTNSFVMNNTMGLEVGDWLFIASAAGSDCDALQVRSMSTATPFTITSSGQVPAYAQDSRFSNMGAQPILRRWSVSGSATASFALQTSNLAAATPAATEDAYPDVVLLRALFAKDTNADGSIDTYDATQPSSRAEWDEVIGIRLALVVRSTHWNKDAVTTAAPQWNLGPANTVTNGSACANDSNSQCIALTLTHTSAANEWQHYRYRTYDSMIPLRNLLWNVGLD